MTKLLKKLKSLIISKKQLANFEQACSKSDFEKIKFAWRKEGLQYLVNLKSFRYFQAACLSEKNLDDTSRQGVINFLWRETDVKSKAHFDNNSALIIAATLGDEATFFLLWSVEQVRSAQQDVDPILLAACLGNCYQIVAALCKDMIIHKVTSSYCALILEVVSLTGNSNIFKLLWQNPNFKQAAHQNDNKAYLIALSESHQTIVDLLWQEEEVKKLAQVQDNWALYLVCIYNDQKNFARLWQIPQVRNMAHVKDNRALMASCNIDSLELFKQLWQENKVRQFAHVNDNRLLFFVCCPYPNIVYKPTYQDFSLKYRLKERQIYASLINYDPTPIYNYASPRNRNIYSQRFIELFEKLWMKQIGLPDTKCKSFNWLDFTLDNWYGNYRNYRWRYPIVGNSYFDKYDFKQIHRFNVYAFKLVWQELEVRRLAHLNDNHALYSAINCNKHECIELLWQQLEVRNTAQVSDNRVLEATIYRNNLSMFKQLWQQPLVRQSAIASIDIVKHTNFGTQDDVSFNQWIKNRGGYDSLSLACKLGTTEIFRILWKAIDKNILLRTQNNAYFLQACFHGHSAIVELLWQTEAIRRLAHIDGDQTETHYNYGDDLSLKKSNIENNCAFNAVCLFNYIDIAKLLWQSAKVRQRAVAQHLLAINNHNINLYLINYARNIDEVLEYNSNRQSTRYHQPLLAACFQNQHDIIALMIEAPEFRSILHLADNRLFLLACEYGWIEVVQKLWQFPLVREQAHASKNLALLLALSLGNKGWRSSLISLEQNPSKGFFVNYYNHGAIIGATTKSINNNNKLWRNWKSYSGSCIAYLLWQEPLVRKAAQLDYAKLLLAAAILPEPAHYQAIYQEAKLNIDSFLPELKNLLCSNNYFDVFKLIDCLYVLGQLKALLDNNSDRYRTLNLCLGAKLMSSKADFNKFSAIIGQALSLKLMRWYTNKYQVSQLLLPMRELKALPIECCDIILSFLKYEQDWLEFVVNKDALGGMADKVQTFKILSTKHQGQALLMQYDQALELITSSQAPSRPLVRFSVV